MGDPSTQQVVDFVIFYSRVVVPLFTAGLIPFPLPPPAGGLAACLPHYVVVHVTASAVLALQLDSLHVVLMC